MEQLTPDQLKEAMAQHSQRQAQEQEERAQSEQKVWMHTIFKERSAFWCKIYDQNLVTQEYDLNGGPSIKVGVEESAKTAAIYADAAISKWDDRFLPKPPQEITETTEESQNA